MSYTNWRWLDTSKDHLDWQTCEELWRHRAYKRKDLRVDEDDTRLAYRIIAPYTAAFYDEVKKCFVICIHMWSMPRWRKILEVHRNWSWKLFGDLLPTDDAKTNSQGYAHCRDSRIGEDSTYSTFAQNRLNTMLPSFLYTKRNRWYINNRRCPAVDGMSINHNTGILFPRYWNITASPFNINYSRGGLITEHQRCEIVSMIKTYVSNFINITYSSGTSTVGGFRRKAGRSTVLLLKPGVASAVVGEGDFPYASDNELNWIRKLVPYYTEEQFISDRRSVMVKWSTFKSDSPGVELYRLLSKCEIYPVLLLYKAMRSKLMSSKFISNFLWRYQGFLGRSIDCPGKDRECEFAKEILTEYLMSFIPRFKDMRDHIGHESIMSGEIGHTYSDGIRLGSCMR